VRLLFDQNLAPRLVHVLAEEYPGSVHVSAVGLERASDRAVAGYAMEHGLAVVTKDADFTELAVVAGSKLKVVWLRLGNCTTADIERVLRGSREAIELLGDDPVAQVLSLS
jgi:predicted nuclease of predicted toxin-antitoxin system